MGREGARKTTVEIDMGELQRAQQALGTRGIRETIDAALRDVNRRSALREAAEHVRAGHLHAPDADVWATWRAPRGPG